MTKHSVKGPLFVFASALLFGSYGVWAVLLGSGFGVFFQGYVRSFLVLLILVPIAVFRKAWKPLDRGDWRAYAWCCGFGVFTQAPLYYAFQHSGVGISSLMFFSALLITSYIVGFAMMKERATTVKVVSLFLAIAGLAFTFFKSVEIYSLAALLLAALNGVASGGEVATTKLVPKKFSALQTSILIWGSIFVTHLIASFIAGETQVVPALDIHWLAMLGFTAAGLLAFWLVIEGFKYVEASIGGLIGLLEVVAAIAFGVLVFHERITWPILIGSLLIIAAAALPYIKRKGGVA